MESYGIALTDKDKLRILVRVNYGYYVVERILIRCNNEEIKANLRNYISSCFPYLGSNQLKNKWVEMLNLSSRGILDASYIRGD